MQRIIGEPKTFEIVRLLDAFARSRGLSLHDKGSQDSFIADITKAMTEQTQNPIVLHGLRIQSMFAYIAASLGECTIITEEDSGDFFSSDADLKRPDFRVLTKEGQGILVEVKNFHQDNPMEVYKLKSSYLSNLRQYADRFGCELKIAVYWSRRDWWTLVSADGFQQEGEHHWLSFPESLKINEMGLIGDCMVGTVPPLSLKLFTNPKKPRTMQSDGTVVCTFEKWAFYCGGKEIEDPFEQQLAWFFIMFGKWSGETPAEIIDYELISIEFLATPIERANPEEEFEIIGTLSQMISKQYNEMTAPEGDITVLSPKEQPGRLGVLIPPEFKGDTLRLWRFYQGKSSKQKGPIVKKDNHN